MLTLAHLITGLFIAMALAWALEARAGVIAWLGLALCLAATAAVLVP